MGINARRKKTNTTEEEGKEIERKRKKNEKDAVVGRVFARALCVWAYYSHLMGDINSPSKILK